MIYVPYTQVIDNGEITDSLVPMGWADSVISQAEMFPKGAHDDLVDSSSMALRWMRENGIAVRTDEMEAQLDDDSEFSANRQETVANHYGV